MIDYHDTEGQPTIRSHLLFALEQMDDLRQKLINIRECFGHVRKRMSFEYARWRPADSYICAPQVGGFKVLTSIVVPVGILGG